MGFPAHPDKITLLAFSRDNKQAIEGEPVENREDPGIHLWYRRVSNQEGKLRYNPRPSGVDGLRIGTAGPENGQSQRGRAKSCDSHRLVVNLPQQIIDVINNIIWAHGAEYVFHGLRLRKGVKLLRAMDARELKDQCETQCGVALHTQVDIRSLIVRRLELARVKVG